MTCFARCPEVRAGWLKPAETLRNARGVTLIEVLVVIAIIGVLLGLATPALLHAKRAGYAAQCLQNVSASSAAILQYSNDFKDTFPYRARTQSFANAFEVDAFGLNYFDQAIFWPGPCREYLGRAPVPKPAKCPVVMKHLQQTSSNPYPETTDPFSEYVLSYGLISRPELWSESATPDPRLLQPTRLGDVLQPSRKAMLVEVYALHLRGVRENNATTDRDYFLELPPGSTKSRPVSLCDGSARELNRAAFREPFAGTMPPTATYRVVGVTTPDGARGVDLK